eukprot:2031275-Rhodomonas_salina.2
MVFSGAISCGPASASNFPRIIAIPATQTTRSSFLASSLASTLTSAPERQAPRTLRCSSCKVVRVPSFFALTLRTASSSSAFLACPAAHPAVSRRAPCVRMAATNWSYPSAAVRAPDFKFGILPPTTCLSRTRNRCSEDAALVASASAEPTQELSSTEVMESAAGERASILG